MRSRIQCVAATAALLFGAAGAQAANPIANGNFDTPVVIPGTFTNFNVGSTALTGWSVTGPNSGANVSIVSGTFAQNGVTFEAAPGNNQWLDLTGDGSNTTEGVSQVVSTTPGTRY